MPYLLKRNISTIHCSDYVREIHGRHVGRVVALQMANAMPLTVTVRWLDSGWLSDLDISAIEFAEKE